jgi:hypothetical protein
MLGIFRESAKNSTGDIRMVSVVAAKTVPLEDRLRLRQRARWQIGLRDWGGSHNEHGTIKNGELPKRVDVTL